MRARMALALNLIRNSKEPVRLIASGGAIGTGGEIITEAQLIDITLRSLGIPKLYREDFSQESIGNVAWTALGLFQPLQIDRAIFVTDELHAPRIKAIADHLLSGKVTVEVAAAPWPLSEQERADEVQREVDGWKFIERFLEEVPPGELIGAIEWVSENHKSFPYLGIEVEDIVAVIRGQMLDFNTAIGFGDAALPVAPFLCD
jgi:hypothetical protein